MSGATWWPPWSAHERRSTAERPPVESVRLLSNPGLYLALCGQSGLVLHQFFRHRGDRAGPLPGLSLLGRAGGRLFLPDADKLASILRSRVAQTAAILLTLAACLSLCYALAIPYLPEQFPRYADLHVILAALACVLLMLALLVALLALYRRQPDRYVPLLRAWFIIVGICGVLFLIPQMVSSALEVFFTISAALLVRKAWLYRR